MMLADRSALISALTSSYMAGGILLWRCLKGISSFSRILCLTLSVYSYSMSLFANASAYESMSSFPLRSSSDRNASLSILSDSKNGSISSCVLIDALLILSILTGCISHTNDLGFTATVLVVMFDISTGTISRVAVIIDQIWGYIQVLWYCLAFSCL